MLSRLAVLLLTSQGAQLQGGERLGEGARQALGAKASLPALLTLLSIPEAPPRPSCSAVHVWRAAWTRCLGG